MTVLCMCIHSAYTVQYVVQNALCYTGKVVIVFLAPSSVIKRVLELEAREPLHTFIYLDEADFNLANGRRLNGRNRIGQRATIDVPGQRGGNITVCSHLRKRRPHPYTPSWSIQHTTSADFFRHSLQGNNP